MYFCRNCGSQDKETPDMVCPHCGYKKVEPIKRSEMKALELVKPPKQVLDENRAFIFDDLNSNDPMINTLGSISRRYEVTLGSLYHWLHRPENVKEYERAKQVKAFYHAEQAGIELEGTSDSNPEVKLKTERSYYHRWMAEKFNQKQFGKNVSIEVTDVTLTPEERAKKLAELQSKIKRIE